MKLIDILARELKVWPESVIKLSQSFAGMVFYSGSAGQIVPLFRTSLAKDWRVVDVTRAEWQVAVDALKAPENAVPEWSGEGLPPAGSEFERRFIDEPRSSWSWGKVIALGNRRIFYADRTGDEWSHSPDDMELRPIRTIEQIAADKRLHEIRNECSEIHQAVEHYNVNIDCSTAMRAVVEAMIDAGYRKP